MHDAPARADHAAQLAQAARQIGEVAHAEGGERAVERGVAIGQVVPVGGVGVDVRRRLGSLRRPARSISRAKSAAATRAPGDAARDLQRAVQRAGAEIEHARRLAQPLAAGARSPSCARRRRSRPT